LHYCTDGLFPHLANVILNQAKNPISLMTALQKGLFTAKHAKSAKNFEDARVEIQYSREDSQERLWVLGALCG
jgi:hypothetical protein